ncbi:MAG: hypothetical protein ACRD5B_13770, partial [Nitrososphaeraceae archaeon]
VKYNKNKNSSSSSSIGHALEETPIELGEIGDDLNSDAFLSDQTRMEMISAIPCYCDIQFKRKEFLTVLQFPDHPFAKQLEHLSMTGQIKV